jgi:hypothetical protein
MATYKQIQKYVKNEFGISVKTCYIAHVKEICGLPLRMAHNRFSPQERQYPCPEDKIDKIKKAFRHFGMIK